MRIILEVGKDERPYGGFVSAVDRKGEIYIYPILVWAKSKEDTIHKEKPIAFKRFPEDEYSDIKIEVVGPE